MQETIFGILGGLVLFIFGIRVMSEGLQKFAAQKMRKILSALTHNRIMGVLTGTGITAIIQSSSATTVMLVGFVNAGLMTLTQSLGVILGANIGTTITAQLIAFNLTKYALPILAFGGLFYLFGKNRKLKYFGQAVFGFGILFLGLNMMTSVVKHFGDSEVIKNLFINFSANPLLAVLAGLLVTMFFQSSSVTIGLTIALAAAGLIDVRAALPLVLGENIGTCITAILASIGTSISARRTAIAHALFNITGVIIALIILPILINIVKLTSADPARQIANGHTIFNIAMTLLFLPLITYFACFIKKIIPGKEIIVEKGPKYLEKHLLNTPDIAIDAATKEINKMAQITREMVKDAYKAFVNNDRDILKKIEMKEDVVDELQEAITQYLAKLTRRELGDKESSMIPALLHSVNDVERIGDHAVNLSELAERKMDKKLIFSEFALNELEKMYNNIDNMLVSVIKALPNRDRRLAKKTLCLEDKTNFMTIEFRNNHLQRLRIGKCRARSSVVFLDMIMNFEKIGDHLKNISHAILGELSWNNNHK